MPLNFEQVRQHLDRFEFGPLFIDELGWSRPSGKTTGQTDVQGTIYDYLIVAQLGSVPVLEVRAPDGTVPDADRRHAIHRELAKLHFENLLIFIDTDRARSVWYWVRREEGRETPRSHEYLRGQQGDAFFGNLAPLLFEISDFDKNGDIEIVKVAQRLRQGLDVEKVTKKFYNEFQQQHLQFLELITGIDDERQLRWYASVLLNRLMFIWFLQRKGFVDNGDLDYLEHKMAESKRRGENRFFGDFLKLLFFEGFAKPDEERSAEARERLGAVRYLNGGLFLPHAIEQSHPDLDVPDKAFENLFVLFRAYSWNLDDTPGGDANEINPDILGYIFEKYINQKAFGAYYTRPEITTYLCERTIERLVLDAVNTPNDEHLRALPGKNYEFKSLGDLLLNLDAALCRKLFKVVLPKLSILDPACGSGAFLVAAMKTLIKIYGGVVGRVRFIGDNDLRREIAEIERTHPNIDYFVKKSIITDNLYGVDIMEEAVEIARLRLFLALVASARSIDHLEPLPNIDFNLLPGNSLIGLMRVDEKKFETGDLFRKTYRQVVDEKNREVATYRHTASYHHDLRALRDKIDGLRSDAAKSLDKILLEEFGALGIKYEEATWDHAKQREGKAKKRGLTLEDIRDLQPFHWGYEFDEIVNKRGGFDAILTNPPWEIFKPNAKEFFEQFSSIPVSRKKMHIDDFEKEQAEMLRDGKTRAYWLKYLSLFSHQSEWYRHAAEYSNQSGVVDGKTTGSDINLYKLFLERCFRLLKGGGTCGIVVPSGVYTDLGTAQLRRLLFESCQVDAIISLSNERYVFEGVHHSFRLCLLSFSSTGATTAFNAAFRINPREAIASHQLSQFLHDPSQRILYPVELLRRLSPSSLSVVELKNDYELTIARKLSELPRLGSEPLRVHFTTEFHMSGHRHLFRKAPTPSSLPVFEGKMIGQFESDSALARYWVDEQEGRDELRRSSQETLGYESYRGALRRVGRNTDRRTLIATVLPKRVFASESFHLIDSGKLSLLQLCYVVGLLNSFALDYQARQRVAANISMFQLYQLFAPTIAEHDWYFARIAENVARLLLPREEFGGIVSGCGLEVVDVDLSESGKTRLRSEIDALVALAYGFTEREFAYILSTFPVADQDHKDTTLKLFTSMPDGETTALLKLIASGESSRLEFKATARWSIKHNRADKEMEQMVIKTVAAFLNSEGGTLLIGVTDDGEIHGLRDDYKTLGGKQNADIFENWLTSRLLDTMGRDIARLLSTSFATIEGKQICRVDIRRSWRPVFTRDGQNSEQLYVRAGNSTRMLGVSEALEYCREHFARVREANEERPAEMPATPTAPKPEVATSSSAVTNAAPNVVFHFKKKKDDDEPRRRLIDEYELEDVIAMVRDVVSGSEPLDREDAIRQIGRQMGAERVGSRIRELIESGLNAASRRSITYTDHRGLRALCRTIDDYKRDDLKNVLRAAVGRIWTDENDAIRLGARYLGFRRTGSRIEQAFRSAIRGGLRQGTLERNGNLIRAT
jgi:schlafen family protein/Eco57I restriction-modification methylase